jgi:PAS domain S-box-containing protein
MAAEPGPTAAAGEPALRDGVARAVVDAALDCVILMDEAGVLREFNPAAERVFGHRRQDVLGRMLGDLIVPERMRAAHAAGLARLVASGQSRMVGRRIEIEALRADGSQFPVELAIVELWLEGRRLFAAYLRDLTDSRQAEAEIRRQREQLHQSEKVAALGSLLAGVAHELNNPLSVVVGRALMIEEDPRYPELAVPLARLRAAAERCSRIVKSFLAMARRSDGAARAPVNLVELVRAALHMLHYSLATAGIAVEFRAEGDPPTVWGEQDRLFQVALNLLVNAQQALADAPAPRRLWVTVAAVGADGARVEVADNGPGIPGDLRQRVFEPFFTTKPRGAGTGIGLSLCRSIVEEHDGSIAADERTGGGACIAVCLPIGKPEAPAPSPAPEAAQLPGSGTILVVDDEPEILAMLQEALERDGFKVVLASSGAEALSVLAAGGVDLVLSDIRMADVDGIELYRGIGARFPALAERFMAMTGDTLGSALDRLPADVRLRLVEKPIDLTALRRLLAERLARLEPGSGATG